ncbi:MAG: hypothetical protein DRP47_10500, partial [Candidatus Zixiibacteriota bacterium]
MVAEKRKRIYELAKDFRISSNAMLTVLRELKFAPKSHMSIATSVMIAAVKKKFAESKKEAKKEMQQRTKASKQTTDSGVSSTARIGQIKVDNSKSSVAGMMRKIEKKQKRKDRRKRKNRHTVDQEAVHKTFKSTRADLNGVKQRLSFRRGDSNTKD